MRIHALPVFQEAAEAILTYISDIGSERDFGWKLTCAAEPNAGYEGLCQLIFSLPCVKVLGSPVDSGGPREK